MGYLICNIALFAKLLMNELSLTPQLCLITSARIVYQHMHTHTCKKLKVVKKCWTLSIEHTLGNKVERNCDTDFCAFRNNFAKRQAFRNVERDILKSCKLVLWEACAGLEEYKHAFLFLFFISEHPIKYLISEICA